MRPAHHPGLGDDDIESADDVLAQECPETYADETGGMLDFALPGGIPGPHLQDRASQFNRRHTIDGGSYGRPPGERHFFRSQRRVSQYDCKSARHDAVDRDHSL